MKIGVLMGGPSSEREVSLNTGKNVHAALLQAGEDAVALEWKPDGKLVELLAGIDVVWIALHGTWGEDGCVQGLLECLRIPYTGSGVTASAIAMDKILSKRLFEHHGVPTAIWTDDVHDAERIGYPMVVKPSREGSTVGISIVKKPDDLAGALSVAWEHKGTPMLERYVPGREASVAILDDRVLGTVEIRPKKEFYDYESKYQRNDTEYLVPAPFAPDVDLAIKAAALRAHNALGCEGYSRVDVRVTDDGEPFVLEVNTLPGMTNTSLIPKIARHAGMDYAALVVRILRTAKLRA